MKMKNGGISFAGALLIAFIVLKLCRVIDWSWLWVLSPLWIGVTIRAVVGAVSTVLSRRRVKKMLKDLLESRGYPVEW